MNVKKSLAAIMSPQFRIFLVIWLIGCVLTGGSYFITDNYFKNILTERTEIHIEQAVELVKTRFKKYEYGLLNTRSSILTAENGDINRQHFERYIASMDLAKYFTGARGFGFIRRVSVEQEDDFVIAARNDGAPDFKVHTLMPHNKDRFIVQYIYPQLSNDESIGLDIASESNRRAAAISASISGEATLSAPITLVQEEGKERRGFLILLPIYNTPLVDNMVEKSLQSTIGWAFAPLVVDDVLFDLAPAFSEIDLTISDKAENNHFFESLRGQNKFDHDSESVINREIEFMGRSWVISAKAVKNVEEGLYSYSPIWFLFLFLLMTSLSYFISVILAAKYIAKRPEVVQNNNVSPREFFSRRGFINSLKGYLFIMISILAFSGYLYVEQEFNSVSTVLIDHAGYSKELIDNHEKSYKEGLTFIKSTPMIKAVTKVGQTSSLPFELSEWKAVVADIFRAYMQSQEEMYQIRLISAQGQGKELVRVERKDGEIFITPSDDLQNKGNRDYFVNTVKLKNGEIYTSNIEPNIENGEIELPIRLTRRYSTPLFYPDGTIFGIIVINVEAEPLLQEINNLSKGVEVIYILDEEQRFILSNYSDMVNDSFFEQGNHWEDVFHRTANIFSALNNSLSTWESHNDALLSAETLISPNQGDVTGQLMIRATFSTTEIYKSALILLLKQMLIFLAFSILALMLFYYSWANNTRMIIASQVKKELDAQKQKDNMFESLTELSPEAMVIIDTAGVIVLINSQAEKLFGYSREQLVGEKINMLVPVSVAGKHDSYVNGYVNKPRTRPMGMANDLFSRHADGSEFPVEVSLSPIQLDDKLLIASSIRNISERKKIEKTLTHAIEKAKSASQAKTAFLANMSHEIRTPLNAVIGLTHLLKGNDLTPEQLTLVSNIQLAGRSLLGIVNDILDLSKIEANEMKVVLEPCNLQHLLDDIYNVFSNQAHQKNITLSLHIDSDLTPVVLTDKKLLQQIITNLLSNAIKFTREGSVTLNVTRETSDNILPNQELVRFTIEDTGIGISPKQQNKIFHPFNQADDGINRRFDGTGLGLSIVSNLSELLGGEVGVSSEQGVGSRFWFEVPFTETNQDDGFTTDSIIEALNIWVLGDTEQDNCTMKKIGTSLGWRVFCGSTVEQFKQEFQQRLYNSKTLPDVVVIDWEQYHLDCLPLVDEIFKLPSWPQVPVIAVCAAEQQKHVEQLDSERIKGILLHPVQPAELFSLVNKVLIEHTGDTSRVLASTKMEAVKAKWLPGVRILVVDDNQMNLDVVEKILANNGAAVTTANSGTKAIDALKDANNDFDVVLMDVQMPEMDGLETTSVIRQQLNIKQLPIIALTAGTLTDEKNRALNIGMNAFLSKPIEPGELILCLRMQIEHYREKPVMIEHIDSAEACKSVANWPEIAGITNSVDLFQGNLELFEFALRRLFEEYRDFEALRLESFPFNHREKRLTLAAELHKLRGSTGMVGAKALYNLTSQAEISLRKGEHDEQPDLLIKIIKGLKELRVNSQHFLEQQAQIKSQKNLTVDPLVDKMAQSEVEMLIVALETNALSANETVENNAAGIMSLIGKEAFLTFYDQVQMLNYVKALEILKSNMVSGNEG
ncbi:CHASE domain-containing protein [Shewanella sp. ER-Te-42B-Light]|uniref:histidine kinase n=1 Tax=Shewanella metallivivens TaxID=2872342 RepID=A0ABT5TQB2_9GAMM|nr:CHASE domain-containing protein [Shewanella metallivivens]